MKRRMLALAMAVAMTVSLLPTSALADSNSTTVVEQTEETEESEEILDADDAIADDAASLEESDAADENAAEAVADTDVVYTATDGDVTVKVTAPAGALPDGAVLSITVFDEEDDEYTYASNKLGLDEGMGMAAFDLTFTVNGTEVEPTEVVSVSVDASALIPVEADTDSLEIYHLEKKFLFTKSVLVADTKDVTEGSINAETMVADFEVESFSTFTITWSQNSTKTITVTVKDTSGNDISASIDNITITEGTQQSLTGWTIEGYTFDHAEVTYTTSSNSTAQTVSNATAIQYSGSSFAITADQTINGVTDISSVVLYYSSGSETVQTVDVTFTAKYGTTSSSSVASGATITIRDSEGNILYSGTTSSSGTVTLTIPAGSYSIVASYGYKSSSGNKSTYSCYSYDGTVTVTSDTTSYSILMTQVAYEHIDIKDVLASTNGADTSTKSIESITQVLVYNGDTLLYTTSSIGTNTSESNWQCLWNTSETGLSDKHSLVFYTNYDVVIYYTIKDSSDGSTTSDSIKITASTVYPEGTVYPTDGANAYKLYNYLYADTAISSNSSIPSDTVLDISGMSLYLVAMILCDSSSSSSTKGVLTYSSASQWGFDFAISVAVIEALSAEITLEFTKELKNGEMTGSEGFSFTLYNATVSNDIWTRGEQADTASTSGTVTSDSDGNSSMTIVFDDVEENAGTYYYIAVENALESDAYTYDSTVYGVKVEVTSTGTATATYYKLTANTTDSAGSDAAYAYTVSTEEISDPTFTNIHRVGSLSVTKTVSGISVPADSTEYTVTITAATLSDVDAVSDVTAVDGDGNAVTLTKQVSDGKVTISFTIKKDQTVTLSELPWDTYTVVETNAQGAISTSYSYTVDSGETTTSAASVTLGEDTYTSTQAVYIENVFPSTGSMSVTKKVEDSLNLAEDNASYTVVVSSSATENPFTGVTATLSSDEKTDTTVGGSAGAWTLTFIIQKDETVTLDNLPVGSYTVSETIAGAYSATYADSAANSTDENSTVESSYTIEITADDIVANTVPAVTITNTYPAVVITGTKTWNEAEVTYDSTVESTTGTSETVNLLNTSTTHDNASEVSFTIKRYVVTSSMTEEEKEALKANAETVDASSYYVYWTDERDADGVAYTSEDAEKDGYAETYVIYGLPACNAYGQAYIYIIEENTVAGYDSFGDITGSTGDEDTSGSFDASVTSSYTYDYDLENKAETTSLSFTKRWFDDNNNDARSEYGITLVGTITVGGDTVEVYRGTEVTLDATTTSYNWSNLPTYTNYTVGDGDDAVTSAYEITWTVEETTVPTVYTMTESTSGSYNEDGELVEAEDGTFTWTITNSYPVKSVTIVKKWDDANNQDGKRDAIEVKIVGTVTIDGVETVVVAAKTATLDGTADDENGDDVDSDGNWTYTWNNLPVYYNGVEITYTVTEVSYPTSYTAGTVTLVTSTEDADAEGNEESSDTDYDATYKVTNSYTPETISISGTKTWDDANNQDGIRPESITVNLLVGDEVVDSATVTADDNWSYSFTDLPKYADGEEITYTISEEAVDGYTTTISGYDITNSYTPGKTSVDVTKVWDDADDQDGIRPTEITITLYADDVVYDTYTIKASDNWTLTIEDLDEYANGKEITYTVVESSVTGYTASYSDDTFAITNKHTPETTKIEVTKNWDDNDNQDGIRPSEITITLYADGVEVKDYTITADNDWTLTIEDLDKYANGKEITYTVVESSVTGYTASYTDDTLTITNTHTPETTSITVDKVWVDKNNQDGIRPASITFTLYADGEEVDTYTITADDDWTLTIKNLDKYANGEEITYTIKEDEVEGYESEVDGYTITNTHETETVEITVTKEWEDNNDQDGVRPDEITFTLYADNEKVDTYTITAEDNWTLTIKDLDKYANGEEITYTIEEDEVEGYESEVDGYAITNTHETETVEITITKGWDDADNQDGVRPDEITFTLYADGEKVDTYTITAENNWTLTIEDLDKYANGEVITYTIEENEVDGYESDVDGYTITNTHTPETIEISGTKTWDDADNQDGKRPGSITIRLYADGEEVESVEVTADDNWSYSFTDLAKYAAGKEITYTITEDAVEDYSTTYDGYDITNSYTPGETSITVTKAWDDADDQDGIRPEGVTVELLKNKEATGLTVELSEENNWRASFTELAVYTAGVENTYTVEEVEVTGYTTVITGDASTGYTITNTHTPETTSIAVNKVWDDAENQDGVRPTTITVNLLADGEKVDSAEITANEDGNWSYTFTDLAKYRDGGKEIVYTIEEDAVEDYTTEITGTASAGYTVTNTHTPATIEISGTKTWDDADNQDGRRPNSITIRLYANGEEVESVEVTADDDWSYSFTDLAKYAAGVEITYTITEDAVDNYSTTYDGYNITNSYTPAQTSVTVTKAWNDADNQDGIRPGSVTVELLKNGESTGETVELNASNNWTASFTELAVYTAGKKNVYTVKEISVEGYTSAITGDASTGYTITNTHTPETIEISGTKTWDDADNQDGKRPGSITIRLYADGEEVESVEVTADENGNWNYSFTDLAKYAAGKEIAYTITEDAVEDYSTTYDGYDITNSYTPGETSISVTKAWDDANDQDGIRPESVTVELLKNGEATGLTVELSEENNWRASFTELAVYTAGVENTYTVEEVEVTGYTTVITGDASVGYIITNSHTPETTSITVNKVWDDANDQDGLRPTTITVNLLADGELVDSAEITADEDGSWSYTFTDLAKNRDGGTEIVYTITEDAVEGYTTEITGNASDGYTITNTHTPEEVLEGDDDDEEPTPTEPVAEQQTGDTMHAVFWLVAFLLAAVAIVMLTSRRKRFAKNNRK